MQLPGNGKVIIIDDKPDQALPLILALSKNNIPSCYYDARVETLPVLKHTDVRVLFLDINLNDAPADWETEKSLLRQFIEGIIEPHIPYLLFIWSVNEKDNIEKVVELFATELHEYAPLIAPMQLKKYELFDLDPDSGQYTEAKGVNIIKEIEARIEVELKNFDSLEPLIKWENIVHSSSSEVIKDIFSLASNNDDMNNSIKGIYFKLAEAMWGKQLISGDDQGIVIKAATIFNQLLNDRIDYHINQKLEISLIKGISAPKEFKDNDRATFNSKLLLSIDGNKAVLPGNIYEYKADAIRDAFPYKGMIADTLNIPMVAFEFFHHTTGKETKDVAEAMELKRQQKKSWEKFERTIRDSIKACSKFIAIETSPICDYVQKKWKSNRLCPALLWDSSCQQYIAVSENLYVSPLLEFTEGYFHIVIDMRYFTSYSFDHLLEQIPIARLKHSFLVDIQSHLSRHISRPGISFLS